MSAFRAGLVPFAALALSFTFQRPARPGVRKLRPVHILPKRTNPI